MKFFVSLLFIFSVLGISFSIKIDKIISKSNYYLSPAEFSADNSTGVGVARIGNQQVLYILNNNNISFLANTEFRKCIIESISVSHDGTVIIGIANFFGIQKLFQIKDKQVTFTNGGDHIIGITKPYFAANANVAAGFFKYINTQKNYVFRDDKIVEGGYLKNNFAYTDRIPIITSDGSTVIFEGQFSNNIFSSYIYSPPKFFDFVTSENKTYSLISTGRICYENLVFSEKMPFGLGIARLPSTGVVADDSKKILFIINKDKYGVEVQINVLYRSIEEPEYSENSPGYFGKISLGASTALYSVLKDSFFTLVMSDILSKFYSFELPKFSPDGSWGLGKAVEVSDPGYLKNGYRNTVYVYRHLPEEGQEHIVIPQFKDPVKIKSCDLLCFSNDSTFAIAAIVYTKDKNPGAHRRCLARIKPSGELLDFVHDTNAVKALSDLNVESFELGEGEEWGVLKGIHRPTGKQKVYYYSGGKLLDLCADYSYVNFNKIIYSKDRSAVMIYGKGTDELNYFFYAKKNRAGRITSTDFLTGNIVIRPTKDCEFIIENQLPKKVTYLGVWDAESGAIENVFFYNIRID